MNKPTFIYPCHAPAASVSATDTAAGYAAANILEGTEDTAWKPLNTTGAKTLTITLGTTLEIGQVAILGKNLNGVTITVNGHLGATNYELSAAAAVTTANDCIYYQFTPREVDTISLIINGATSTTTIMHVACCRAVSLPYLEDGHDPDAFQSEGTHLISVNGSYLGNTQQRAMMSLSLSFGQVTAGQYTPFEQWADACVKTIRPFFYVPDTDQTTCLFGWTDAKYKFTAPYKNGLRRIGSISFNARRI